MGFETIRKRDNEKKNMYGLHADLDSEVHQEIRAVPEHPVCAAHEGCGAEPTPSRAPSELARGWPRREGGRRSQRRTGVPAAVYDRGVVDVWSNSDN